ncbi:hypothetical protein [Motilimonas eburnea]|uniref:hypothetical protein n=1 Tax=Motilimonas eburnea TaxID=1737488 RepID=UPI001E2D48BF|nr:hypothetical protein [Motilimonas eburnea]MCE2572139.1 hypothetical protein [Motilimonas eburnea]
MDSQSSQLSHEPLAPHHPRHGLAANIISHQEPSSNTFNYFSLHAHQLIDPLDILPTPAH